MAEKQNAGQSPNNGGSVQNQVREAGQRAREGAEQVGRQVQEGWDTTRQEAARRYRQAEGLVARNPGSSVLTSFGLGVGVGVVLGLLLSQRERTWYDRYLPDSWDWDDVRDRAGEVPERLRSFGDTASRRLRRWGEQVADRIPGR